MLLSAIILGLIGSLHCVGMCGPIAFMLPVSKSNPSKKALQLFLYHLGRLLAYGSIGLVFGVLGRSLYIFGMQQKLSIIIGIIMIVVVLIPHRVFNRYNFSRPINKILSKIKSGMSTQFKRRSADTFLTIGFLNGFLPCGLVYMALFGAIAMGNTVQGASYMVLFGLGTIPLMTAVAYSGAFIKGQLRNKIRRLVPVFLIVLAVLFILRGLGLGTPYVSPEPVLDTVTTSVECHN